MPASDPHVVVVANEMLVLLKKRNEKKWGSMGDLNLEKVRQRARVTYRPECFALGQVIHLLEHLPHSVSLFFLEDHGGGLFLDFPRET